MPDNLQCIVATDNTIFETLAAWNIPLVAAPVSLLASSSPYANDNNVQNLGTHREPNMELLVSVNPDLILNGQRFAAKYDEIKKLVPGAALVDVDAATIAGADATKDVQLRKQTELLGQVFNKQEQAQEIISEFDAGIAAAKAAYKPEQKVMGLLTSGGNINYAAPSQGRAVGPLFDMVGLTPALKIEGASSGHTGDDISVEAIAASNPDWIIVLDRDAARKDQTNYVSAKELIAASPALQNVPAVQKGQIIYLPGDFYTTESIQAYTKVLQDLAEKFAAAA